MATKPDQNPFELGGTTGAIPTIEPGEIGSAGSGGDRASAGTASAGTASAGTIGSEPKRKRGRPRGSKNRISEKAALSVNTDAITAILLSGHAMLAGITKTPELVLDEREASAISDSAAKVASFYDVTADPKIVAWANLAMILGMVYGTRFVAVSMRKKNERKTRTDNVRPIHPNVAPAGISPDGKMPPFDSPDGTRQ